jgi:hypothetical protein
MRVWQSQAHVKYYCKYHMVFVPKYRRKLIYGIFQRYKGNEPSSATCWGVFLWLKALTQDGFRKVITNFSDLPRTLRS